MPTYFDGTDTPQSFEIHQRTARGISTCLQRATGVCICLYHALTELAAPCLAKLSHFSLVQVINR